MSIKCELSQKETTVPSVISKHEPQLQIIFVDFVESLSSCPWVIGLKPAPPPIEIGKCADQQ
mgnify:CR=1 FL=1